MDEKESPSENMGFIKPEIISEPSTFVSKVPKQTDPLDVSGTNHIDKNETKKSNNNNECGRVWAPPPYPTGAPWGPHPHPPWGWGIEFEKPRGWGILTKTPWGFGGVFHAFLCFSCRKFLYFCSFL